MSRLATKSIVKGLIRKSYGVCLPYIRSRFELSHILNARGLIREGVEVGVKQGAFSSMILDHWRGVRLYSVDPWKEFDEEYQDVANVSQECHDSFWRKTIEKLAPHGNRSIIIRATSDEAVVQFRDGQLDFVYIDAQHHYEAVKKDIAQWWPKIRRGGLLGGHDYLDGVRREGNFGVKTAVDEFAAHNGLALHVSHEFDWKSWFVFKPRTAGLNGSRIRP